MTIGIEPQRERGLVLASASSTRGNLTARRSPRRSCRRGGDEPGGRGRFDERCLGLVKLGGFVELLLLFVRIGRT